MSRFVLAALGLVVVGLLATELSMQPTAQDFWIMAGVFLFTATVAVCAGWVLTRILRRNASLATATQAPAVVGVAVVAVAVAGAATFMALPAHDLKLVLIALGVGLGLAIIVSRAVWRSVSRDLGRIAETAQALGKGRRDVHTGVDRPDELGDLARALDDAVSAVAEAEDERERDQEARQKFLAAVSHDLRTPLTSLQAAVEALQDGVADEPGRYFDAMNKDVAHLRGLVDDLLTLVKIDMSALVLNTQPVDVAELVDGVLETLRVPARRRGIELSIERAEPVVIEADPHALSRILRNLVDNAIRHAPTASTVTVVVEASGSGSDPGSAFVRVVDEGPGFPDEFADRAFDYFTRADEARDRIGGGAGLGLAIARGLVEAHGGTISIQSGPGGHITFTLPANPDKTLPYRDENDATQHASPKRDGATMPAARPS